MRESSCNSEVAMRDGKKLLTRLATLVTLPPRERAVDGYLYKNRGNELKEVIEN